MTTYRLGINTCFAVKRWPQPESWAALVADELELDLVQHSLDLVDLDAPPAAVTDQATRLRAVCASTGLALHSTFTGLAAYSANLLLHPDRSARARARDWYRRVIGFTADTGAQATGGHVGAFSVGDYRDPAHRAQLWRELTGSLAELAGYAQDRGLSYLLAENLAAAREPATMAMIESLLTDGDQAHVPVLLCLDVGHQCVPGTAGPRSLRVAGPAGRPRARRAAPADRRELRSSLAVHAADERGRHHPGRQGAGGTGPLRRRRRRAHPGDHPAVRAGR